jgi:hypothetical protein
MAKFILVFSEIIKWAFTIVQGLDVVKKLLEWIASFKK